MGRRKFIPAEPKPEWFTAVVDTREQTPVTITGGMKTEVGTLETADYSVKGLEHIIGVERKSLQDLLGCVGVERERFDREIRRMIGMPCKALVIESDWPCIELGGWRSSVTPQAVIGSLLGWAAAGIPLILVGDHQRAGTYISRFLYISARRRWREVHGMIAGITDDASDATEGGAA